MTRMWTLPTVVAVCLGGLLLVAATAFGWSGEAVGWPLLAVIGLAAGLHVYLADEARHPGEPRR